MRKDSPTSKLRVVFNASCKMSNKRIINDLLCVDRKLNTQIFAVIMNWRRFKFFISADIVKMFRQILVAPEDRRFEIGEKNVDVYELNTVTHGTNPAPFLSNRVIRHVVQLHKDEFPLAVEPLTSTIYVDDYSSAQTLKSKR